MHFYGRLYIGLMTYIVSYRAYVRYHKQLYYQGITSVFVRLNKESLLIMVFLAVMLASGVDIATDLSHGATMQHVVKEAVILGLSMVAAAWLLLGVRRQNLEIKQLQQQLHEQQNQTSTPEKYILDGRKTLSSVISQQFNDWQLTGSEAEIGWLLLKGLSLKEIALVRNTSEKTVRQQASAIYKKADIAGRHAFSAWFIEDIL